MSLPGKPTNEPRNYFAIGKQTAKDSEASTFFFTKHLSGSGYDAQFDVEAIREGGDGQEVGLRYKTRITGDGSLVTNSRPQVTGRLWAAVLGNDLATLIASSAGGANTRHIAVPVASMPYFTIEQSHADNLERADNCVFTSLKLEGEAGKPWRYTAQFVNGGTITFRDVASALTPARETGPCHMYPLGSYIFDGQASYAQDVTKWSIEVTRGVDDGIQTVGLNRDDVIPLNFDVNVDATVKYTSRAFYQKVSYNGGSVVLPDLATGSLDLTQYASATGMATLALHRVCVPLLQWTDAKVNMLDPDGQTVYLDLVGMNIKGGTYSIFAWTDTQDAAAY